MQPQKKFTKWNKKKHFKTIRTTLEKPVKKAAQKKKFKPRVYISNEMRAITSGTFATYINGQRIVHTYTAGQPLQGTPL